MANCSTCDRELPPTGYVYPLDPREEKKFCKCIKWGSLYSCMKLSELNARRLLTDGDLLIRLSGPKLYEKLILLTQNKTNAPDDNETYELASKVNYQRLMTGLSLVILALQEMGKAWLAMQGVKAKKNLEYESDYRRKFIDHQSRITAGIELLEGLHAWHPVMKEHTPNLERLRMAATYVDYDLNFGLWLDPTSLGDPDNSGSLYSSTLFSNLLELVSGHKDHASRLADIHLAIERFNTFAYCFSLKLSISKALDILSPACDDMMKDPAALKELALSIRFAEFLRVDDYLPPTEKEKQVSLRLARFIEVTEPSFVSFVETNDPKFAEFLKTGELKDEAANQ